MFWVFFVLKIGIARNLGSRKLFTQFFGRGIRTYNSNDKTVMELVTHKHYNLRDMYERLTDRVSLPDYSEAEAARSDDE